jgi:hypothetical protein
MNNDVNSNKIRKTYASIKLFAFSISLAIILWMWGLFATQDLFNNVVNQYNNQAVPAIINSIPKVQQPTKQTELRKVTIPRASTSPVTPLSPKPIPMPMPSTSTGSSR